jgi:hypothetical protein
VAPYIITDNLKRAVAIPFIASLNAALEKYTENNENQGNNKFIITVLRIFLQP